METSEVAKSGPTKPTTSQQTTVLPVDELKRATDLFSILIQIDRREKITKTYEKQNN